MRIRRNVYKYTMVVATFLLVATTVVSCSNKLQNVELGDIDEIPTQVVLDMNAAQTENGMMKMRMQAKRMERYEKGQKESYELFPEGFQVLAYNEEGLLETRIYSDEAKHTVNGDSEQWSAYGNVVVSNYVKGERIETDTLYWDRENQLIYTDCYVRLSSPDGFMQGYGLKSDEMARNAQLLKPFNSFGIISNDSVSRYQDTVNFIGPRMIR